MAKSISSLPIGTKVKDLDTRYYGSPIVFRLIDKNHNGYPANSVTLLTDRLITLKAVDGKEPSNPNTDRRDYGNNRYSHSNIRQWLNKDWVSWFAVKHSYDTPPIDANVFDGRNNYETESGFLSNFSNQLKGKLLTTNLTVVKSSIDGGGSETVQDKVFLLSTTEVGLQNENGVAEGTLFSIFSGNETRKAYPTDEAVANSEYKSVNLNSTTAFEWWLRTANFASPRAVRSVMDTGGLTNSYAYYGHRGVRPAINIPNDIQVLDNPDTDGAYIITWNAVPTLTLNTANNQTLSESAGQNELLIEGTGKDTDANNTVTIKAQINDGTIRNIASAISDGTTSIPFSKRFSYIDKCIYDGNTPISNALSEGVDHKLKVWAEDGQGGTSVIAERKFRVIHNRPPVISDSDRDLGPLIESPSIVYQVNDLEGHAIIVTEKINGKVIGSFEAVPNKDYTLAIPLEMWIPLQLGQHNLVVEATDSAGLKSVRTYTFTRDEDTILLELKNPFETDIAATRILVTPEVYIPIGASIIIEACNNAFDDEPTWEDITSLAMAKRGFSFTNTVKTAEQWGINIRFTLHKGTATQEVRLDGFGGAFE